MFAWIGGLSLVLFVFLCCIWPMMLADRDKQETEKPPPNHERETQAAPEKLPPANVSEETETPSTVPSEPTFDGRLWTDKTGRFTVEAEFVDRTARTVRLRKRDGKVISVPFKDLSERDQSYVRDKHPSRQE